MKSVFILMVCLLVGVMCSNGSQKTSEQDNESSQTNSCVDSSDESSWYDEAENPAEIKKHLPEIVKDVRKRIKENDFPYKDGEDITFRQLSLVRDDPRVFDLYVEIIETSQDEAALFGAVAGLTDCKNKAAIPALSKLLNNNNPVLRLNTADALLNLGEKEKALPVYMEVARIKELIQLDMYIQAPYRFLMNNPNESIEDKKKYRDALNDMEEKVILRAINKLGEINDMRALPILEEVEKNGASEHIRQRAKIVSRQYNSRRSNTK